MPTRLSSTIFAKEMLLCRNGFHVSSTDETCNAKKTDFMEEQFTHILDKGLMDCFFSSYDSLKNLKLYLTEIDRILRSEGFFIYITYAEPNNRLEHLKQIGWKVQVFQLYRTCMEEEMIYFEDKLFEKEENEEVGIKSEFEKVLEENLTKPKLDRFRHKKYHYAYVCQKKQIGND